MTDKKYWAMVSDEELFAAERNISDFQAKAQRVILEEANRRRDMVAGRCESSEDSPSEAWVCANCGEQVEGDYEACWNCQTERDKSTGVEDEVAEKTKAPALADRRRRLARSLGAQLEGRYRDAYRVARATTLVAGLVKFVGISLIVLGVVGAIAIADKSTEVGVLIGVMGVSSGMLVFAVGVLIAAQGQHLLAAIDNVVGTSPFLNDSERADIMRLEVGEEA